MTEVRKYILEKKPNVYDINGKSFNIDSTVTNGITFDGYDFYFVDVIDEMDGEVTESEYDEQGRCYYQGGRDEGTFTFSLNTEGVQKDGRYCYYSEDGEVNNYVNQNEARLIVKALNDNCEVQVDSYENNAGC